MTTIEVRNDTIDPAAGSRAPLTRNTPGVSREIERLADQASYLVSLIARKYAGLGVSFEDLTAAGNVGLVKAAYKFDERKGVLFATYAAFWIRKEIAEAVDNERYLIRVPRYAMDLRRRVLDQGAGRAGLSPAQIERGSQAFAGVESIHAAFDEEGGLALEERLADPHAVAPSDVVLHAEALRGIRRALMALTPRERAVIAFRFGVADQEPLTLRETAGKMGLSRERVRQIEHEAIASLRQALQPPAARPRRRAPRKEAATAAI